MFNFKNISPNADFYSKLLGDLTVLNKNVLYITYMQDKILKIVNKLDIDKGLQKQVDEYFEETPPQTDSDDKEPD